MTLRWRVSVERVAKAFAVVACAWFAVAAAWNMFAMPGSGHLGAGNAGAALTAEQIVRWKILYPGWDYFASQPPSPSTYYCHHPFGVHWTSALAQAIFGSRDFVLYLPAVIMSALTPPLLYKIGKEHWGVVAGAVAACSFVVLPITLGFANYHNLEVMCIFGAMLFFWGHSRYQATSKPRYLVASLLGISTLAIGDWIGYVIAASLLGWSMVRAFVLPRHLMPPISIRPYARWWALSAAVAVLWLTFFVALFQHADKLQDWLSSAHGRGSDGTTLAHVLEARKYWIEFSFTPLAILLGKIALPICVLRLCLRRRDEEIYSLAMLLAATVQYVAFKSGADVHAFWPHYFGAYFALAMAQVAATIESGALRLAKRRWPERAPRIALAVSLGLGIFPALVIAPDGVRALKNWRLTGGRYNDNGTLIRTDHDLLAVLRHVVLPAMPPGTPLDVSSTTGWYWNHQWVNYGRKERIVATPLAAQDGAQHAFWMGRAQGISAEQQKQIAQTTHLRIYGDTWIVDQRETAGPVDAFSLNEREPNFFEWYLHSGIEPVREPSSTPDPFATWEWRTHLGQTGTRPDGEPKTIDQERIAHNAAREAGDTARAQSLRSKIESALDRSVGTRFENGVTLVGARVVPGVNPRLEIWFEGGADPSEAYFHVRSIVEKRNPTSTIPPDFTEREMAWQTPLPPKLWKSGFLYRIDAPLNHRIGSERYFGYFSPGPRREDGRPSTDLATVL